MLAARGISIRYADLYSAAAPPPDPSAAAGLIFLGGPMSVNDDLLYLRTEMQIAMDARERGQPVLGICLGAQLIAKALGARVYHNAVKEVGWFDVELTDAGRQDPLLSALDAGETLLQWHGETFDAATASFN